MTSGDAARRNATRPLRGGTEIGDYVTASVSAYEPPRSAVFEVKEAKLGDKVLPVETPRGPYEVALRIVADAIAVDSGTGKDDRWWGRRRLQDRAGRILGAASGCWGSASAYTPPRNAVYISCLEALCGARHPCCHRILRDLDLSRPRTLDGARLRARLTVRGILIEFPICRALQT